MSNAPKCHGSSPHNKLEPVSLTPARIIALSVVSRGGNHAHIPDGHKSKLHLFVTLPHPPMH